jgi:hypothetical protein
MTKKSQRPTTDKGFPVDDRPVIFNLIDSDDVTFIGRYIESEAMFMLSLNDEESDFVSQEQVNEWWYITDHPIVLKEVLNKKSVKKDKSKKEDRPKYRRKSDDSEKKLNSEPTSETQNFSVPRNIKFSQPPLPPFLRDFVRNIEEQTGVNFQAINVCVLGEDDLPSLPKEVLEELLVRAESEENWDLAIKVSDAIKSK